MKSCRTKEMTASGQAYTGECLLCGVLIGTDGANDPTVAVFDGTSTSGIEVLPTNTYDASVKRPFRYDFATPIKCDTGIYVSISLGAGACEVTILYRERENWGSG